MPAFFLTGTTGAFLHSAADRLLPRNCCLDGRRTDGDSRAWRHAAADLAARRPPVGDRRANRSMATARRFRGLSRIPARLSLAACLLALGGLAMLLMLDRGSFIPTFKERDLLVEIEAAPGTSHPAMNRIASQATHELRAIPGVRTVSAHIGRAVLSDQVGDVNSGRVVGQPRSRRRL